MSAYPDAAEAVDAVVAEKVVAEKDVAKDEAEVEVQETPTMYLTNFGEHSLTTSKIFLRT
jgi:hypothetical protein